MQTWKDAWWLVKFENRTFPLSFVRFLFTLGLGLWITVSAMTSTEEQATLGIEWLILFITIVFPYMTRAEHVQAKNIGLKKWVSPLIVFTQSMAITKKTIAAYRMCSYLMISLLFNSVFFILFYAFSPYTRAIAPLGTYIVFAIMLICFAIYAGGFQIRLEAGFHFPSYVLMMICCVPLGIIVGVLLFYKTYTQGFIQWMLDLAAAYPITVTVGSIVLAILGAMYHTHGLARKMEKNDY